MVKLLFRAVSVMIAFAASHDGFYAYVFRIESNLEYREVMRFDIDLGLTLAIAFLCWRVPGLPTATAKWHLVTAVGAVSIWVAVSMTMLHRHYEQARSRSAPTVSQLDRW
jgi:hypothetical protein